MRRQRELIVDARPLVTNLQRQHQTDKRVEMPSADRCLRMGASTGSINMGIDEALANLCRDRVTLRFYAWEAPTLSIGYAQRCDDIDLTACRTSAVGVVRRPTGGRAVLHQQDLTYSLILPLRLPWTTFSITESYRLINVCLLRGLERLGLKATIWNGPGQSVGVLSPFCFPAISQYDVMIGKKKVIGSAQRRFPGALLQQGSILLDFDPSGIRALLRRDEQAAAAGALGKVGSLREAMGRLPDRLEVETAIRDGLAAEMGIEFVEGELGPEECERSMQCAAARYASPNWTFRR
jgi:lipoyl(octanoyl) transferase